MTGCYNPQWPLLPVLFQRKSLYAQAYHLSINSVSHTRKPLITCNIEEIQNTSFKKFLCISIFHENCDSRRQRLLSEAQSSGKISTTYNHHVLRSIEALCYYHYLTQHHNNFIIQRDFYFAIPLIESNNVVTST
jgi:hypothetical protein